MLRKMWIQFQRKRNIAGYTGLVACMIFAYVLLMDSIPDKIYVEYGEEPDYSFGVPVTESLVDSAEVFASHQSLEKGEIHLSGDEKPSVQQSGSYQVVCKLFGVVPVKQISVQEVSKKQLVPAGTNVGIYLRNMQIMIIGTGEVAAESGSPQEPAKNVVQSGDYILAVNGEKITNKEQLVKTVAFCEGKKLTLKLLRGKEQIEVSLKPVMSREGIYQLGIWVRDDIAGVGTLTYVTDTMEYGALGHGVTDADVGSLIDLDKGYIYQTTILEIRKGQKGQPGEMAGMINYSENTGWEPLKKIQM